MLKMIGAGTLRCHYAPPSLVLERGGESGPRRGKAGASPGLRFAPPAIMCSAAGSGTAETGASSIPKLEPFSRRRIDRLVKDPSFIQKTENDLTEYCSRLEGDESYSCWRAYFELKDLEEEMPQDDVEKFVRGAGGNKSLIECLHGLTAVEKKNHERHHEAVPVRTETDEDRPFPVPDGLPPTAEELEEEEKARMPDSPFTRLLRRRGKLPAWYSRVPDHETD